MESVASKLKFLHLNLGRWGCETYSSLHTLKSQAVTSVADIIKKAVNLEEL
jgi:hypothetical protein